MSEQIYPLSDEGEHTFLTMASLLAIAKKHR
jgi:hypothetical protein